MVGIRSVHVSLLAVLAACGHAPDAPPRPPVPTATVTATLTATAPPSPNPPSPFSFVTEGWDVTLADTWGAVVVHDAMLSAMVTVEGSRITRVESPFRNLPTGPGMTGAVSGVWPEGALLTVTSGEGAKFRLYRRTKGTWAVERGVGVDSGEEMGLRAADGSPIALLLGAPEANGRTLVVRPDVLGGPILSLGGDGAPRPSRRVPDTLRVEVLSALPTGDVVAIAHEQSERRRVGCRWRPGATKPTTIPLPSDDGPRYDDLTHDVGMCLGPERTVHLVLVERATGKADLLTLRDTRWETTAIFDGETGRRRDAGSSCAVDRDMSVWVMLDLGRQLFHGAAGGKFEQTPYPALPPLTRLSRFEPDPKKQGSYRLATEEIPQDQRVPGTFRGWSVQRAEDGTVWVTGYHKRNDAMVTIGGIREMEFTRTVVLRLGPPLPGMPIDWDAIAPNTIEERLRAYNAQGGLSYQRGSSTSRSGPDCSSVFAQLGDLPKDEDLSALRSLLQGKSGLAGTRFVEARVRGAHVLGALVPSHAVGQRLLALLKGKFPSTRTGLYCFRPHVVRAIPMGIEDE